MNFIFTHQRKSRKCSVSSHFGLIVCIFNLNSNENIYIGLVYRSTTSVHLNFFSLFFFYLKKNWAKADTQYEIPIVRSPVL